MPPAVDHAGLDPDAVLTGTDAAPAPDPDPLRGTPPRRQDVLTAIGVASVVTLFAFVWRSPIVPTDPYHYVLQTLQFPSDNWVALGLSRYGIFLANLAPAPERRRVAGLGGQGGVVELARQQQVAQLPIGVGLAGERQGVPWRQP